MIFRTQRLYVYPSNVTSHTVWHLAKDITVETYRILSVFEHTFKMLSRVQFLNRIHPFKLNPNIPSMGFCSKVQQNRKTDEDNFLKYGKRKYFQIEVILVSRSIIYMADEHG